MERTIRQPDLDMEEIALSVYVGKSLDVFEDVWNLWMKSTGVSAYIHADVLSFRCFAFSCGEDITKWFSPAQPVKMALVELFDNLEIAENCSIVPASDWHKYLSESERPILLADICTGMEKRYCVEVLLPRHLSIFLAIPAQRQTTFDLCFCRDSLYGINGRTDQG